jgi:hypothetical protein
MPAVVFADVISADNRGAFRFVVAGVTGFVVTCMQLRVVHEHWPLRSYGQKAPRWWRVKSIGWWLSIGVLDASVAVGGVAVASRTGSGSAGDLVGWFGIGMLAPLGLRSPVRKSREVFDKELSPGVTYVYDVGRHWLASGLDEHMTNVRRWYRQSVSRQVVGQGWSYGTLLAAIEQHCIDRRQKGDAERAKINQSAYLAYDPTEDLEGINGLVRVLMVEKLHGLLADVRQRGPSDEDQRRSVHAIERAVQHNEHAEVATMELSVAAKIATRIDLVTEEENGRIVSDDDPIPDDSDESRREGS